MQFILLFLRRILKQNTNYRQ